jgi:hypothetical protein
MRYGFVRFVSGFIAALAVPLGPVVIWLRMKQYRGFPAGVVFRAIFPGIFVLAFGLFCLMRFRYWHARAIRRRRFEGAHLPTDDAHCRDAEVQRKLAESFKNLIENVE